MSHPSQNGSRLLVVKKEIVERTHASVCEGIPWTMPLLPQSDVQLHTKEMSWHVQDSHDQKSVCMVKMEALSEPHILVNEEIPTTEHLLQHPVGHFLFVNQRHQLVQTSEEVEWEDDKIEHLSGKEFFDVVLGKSHLYNMNLPKSMTKSLPLATVPAVLKYGGKSWNVTYLGDSSCKRFEQHGWKAFVKDNELEQGDACVFELMENSNTKIRFKVHILRAELPHELKTKARFVGSASDNPIAID